MEILFDRLGTCKYCGQTATMRMPEDATQEDTDQAVVGGCECKGAKLAQQLDKALLNIEALFGDAAEESGLKKITPESMSLLGSLATARVNSHFLSCSLNFSGGVGAKISRNTKGFIEIQRTDKKALKLSTE